jgi:hypothetical protein
VIRTVIAIGAHEQTSARNTVALQPLKRDLPSSLMPPRYGDDRRHGRMRGLGLYDRYDRPVRRVLSGFTPVIWAAMFIESKKSVNVYDPHNWQRHTRASAVRNGRLVE